jgi:hypothetical protein
MNILRRKWLMIRRTFLRSTASAIALRRGLHYGRAEARINP